MSSRPGEHAGAGGTLAAGRVGRAHGLDGSFYVTRPLARVLTLGVLVEVGEMRAAIVRRAGTEQHPIVRLEGVESREAAEALRGTELRVQRTAAPELGAGEWWAHELEGCTVLDGGRQVGTVVRLVELPSCEALEVSPDGGGELLLVPMVRDAVRAAASTARRIDVDLGFLDPEPPARRGGSERGERGSAS